MELACALHAPVDEIHPSLCDQLAHQNGDKNEDEDEEDAEVDVDAKTITDAAVDKDDEFILEDSKFEE